MRHALDMLTALILTTACAAAQPALAQALLTCNSLYNYSHENSEIGDIMQAVTPNDRQLYCLLGKRSLNNSAIFDKILNGDKDHCGLAQDVANDRRKAIASFSAMLASLCKG